MTAAVSAAAHALPGALACLPGPSSARRAPCKSPDPVTFLPPVAGQPGVAVTNFGLLFPGESALDWRYVCDDAFDRPPPERIRRSSSGDIFIPTTNGMVITRDGCSFIAAADLMGQVVYDVAIDGRDPMQVFALVGSPRTLWRSTDGGRRFTSTATFPAGMLLFRVVVPPQRARQIYVIGRGAGSSTPIFASADDGTTFERRDPAPAQAVALRTSLEFVASHPTTPEILYFNVVEPDGDSLWRSSDGGATVNRLHNLGVDQGYAGMAFGAAGTMYVATYDVFPDGTKPPGLFLISRDEGATWLPPRPSPESLPPFGCLVRDGDRLLACGMRQNIGIQDTFLVGASTDEGATWTPVTRLSQLTAPRACVAAQCQAVTQWLCDSYTQCPPGYAPRPTDPAPDAGADGAAADAGAGNDAGPGGMVDGGAPRLPDEDSGCGCRVGGPAPGSASWLLVLSLALIALPKSRRRSR